VFIQVRRRMDPKSCPKFGGFVEGSTRLHFKFVKKLIKFEAVEDVSEGVHIIILKSSIRYRQNEESMKSIKQY